MIRIEYDIRSGLETPPLFKFDDKILIRGIYDHKRFISYLSGDRSKNGVSLNLFADYSFKKETFFQRIHHHISILSENPENYAKVLNTSKFTFIFTRKRKIFN